VVTLPAKLIEWTEPDGAWRGEFEGESHGGGVCVIFSNLDAPGGGPALHRHPYSETFIIRRGNVVFEVAGKELRAEPGQIVVVPAGVSHRFTNAGPGPMEMIDIHANGAFITEWL